MGKLYQYNKVIVLYKLMIYLFSTVPIKLPKEQLSLYLCVYRHIYIHINTYTYIHMHKTIGFACIIPYLCIFHLFIGVGDGGDVFLYLFFEIILVLSNFIALIFNCIVVIVFSFALIYIHTRAYIHVHTYAHTCICIYVCICMCIDR